MKDLVNKIIIMFASTVIMVLFAVPSVSNAATLYWPVPGHTSLSQGFHEGNAIDISDGSIAGADVVAAMGGKVTTIHLCTANHDGFGDCNGFGTGIVISGDDGRIYQYAHMQGGSIPSNVYYGAYVSAGQKIGKVGNTGYSTGNHLHFGISIGNYWNESGINPQNETYTYNTHTHSYTSSVTKQPTCTATGVRTYKCSCGNSYTETIAAKGHSYKNTVVAPTTTEKGYTLHTCSVCGNNYKDTYVNPPTLNSDGYYHCTSLPAGVTSDKYTIQYNNYYETIQANSPGNGWTNAGKVKDAWENSGSQYTSESNLATSDSRVLVRSYYYHFCGPNAGNVGNYEQTGNYVHYDEVDSAYVNVTSSGMDGSHPWYVLAWKSGGTVWCQSGSTCDGSYGSHGARCKAWYKLNVYQNKVHVVQYKFTKYSDWISTKDASAKSAEIRYKLKETTPTVTLSGITVKKTKTAFYVGDAINTDDISVTATYSDKTTKSVAFSKCTTNVSSLDMITAGTKTLTVQYAEDGKTAKGDVSITVSQTPNPSTEPDPQTPVEDEKTEIHLKVKAIDGMIYFDWNAPDLNAVYDISYSLAEELLPVYEENNLFEKMCLKPEGEQMHYECSNNSYKATIPTFFRIRMRSGEETAYSNVVSISDWNVTSDSGQAENAGSDQQEGGNASDSNTEQSAPQKLLRKLDASKTKTEFYVGDELNSDDMTIVATYEDGSTETIDKSKCSLYIKEAKFTKRDGVITFTGTCSPHILVEYEENGVKQEVKVYLQVIKKPQENTEAETFIPVKPEKVIGLKVKAKGSGKIAITWSRAKNADVYQVQAATKKNFKKNKKSDYAYGRKLTMRGLKRGKVYYVRVRAISYDSGKNGSWSAIKKIKVK